MRIVANIISWLFIPLLMPIYGLIVAMFIPSVEQSFFQENTLYWMPLNHKWAVLSMFFIFSFLAPAISLVFLRKTNVISSVELDNRSERATPIFLTAVYALVLSIFILIKAPDALLPKIIYALPWGGFVCVLVAGILTKYDKVSLHALGCGMLLAFFLYYYTNQVEYYFEIIIATILIIGLVLSARLYLNKHSLKQIAVGFLVGFFTMLICIFLFNILFSVLR